MWLFESGRKNIPICLELVKMPSVGGVVPIELWVIGAAQTNKTRGGSAVFRPSRLAGLEVVRLAIPYMQPQQTGVPFIIMQQVQPAFIIVAMQSQQAWIISQHLASPLVQVMTQPSAVISHLHMPMVRLQQQTIMPFIIMQQLHIPPAIIEQRF